MVDKQKQFEIINANNPFNPELGNHTWIKDVSDIKTYEEVWEEEGEIYGITPDFSEKDAINALNSGKIVVYSSHPIKNGTFVTPSKMEAISYAGNHKIYTITANLNDIAWIDPAQGQYANTNITENKKYMKKIIRLTESDLHRIVKKSVNRILKEHHWDDKDFDEDDYDETVNYEYDKEDEGDMFGMLFGGKEETIKRFIKAINRNPNSSDWDKCDYYAAYLFRDIMYGRCKKFFQDIDITLDDIYYLWRTNNEKRLRSIYWQKNEYYEDIKPKKQFPDRIYHDDYIGNRENSVYLAKLGRDKHGFFKDNDIEMDRNLNVYDNGYEGEASLYAQQNDDRGARNLGTTMRQSLQNFEKNKK